MVFLVLALAAVPAAGDWVRREGGSRLSGNLMGLAEEGFRFFPDGGGEPLPLETLEVVALEGPGPGPEESRPPFSVLLGGGLRVSGLLEGLDESTVRLAGGPDGRPLRFERRGVRAVVQRPGEVLILAEPFDRLDREHWAVTGGAAVPGAGEPGGPRGLRVPATGGSVAWHAPEPIPAGRVELIYHDEARNVPGRRLIVALEFRGVGGIEPVEVLLGWEGEVVAVRTRGGGPALAVQRLPRQAGRHRLGLSFGPDRIDLSLDEAELAHGDPPPGPLVGVRIGAEGEGPGPPDGMAATFQDVQIIRRTVPPAEVEIDPTQDEARLVVGDQLFGDLLAADRDGVVIRVDDRRVGLPWSEVAGLYFRRGEAVSPPAEGLWVRLTWRTGSGPRDRDALEGVLSRLDDRAAVLTAPFVGEVTIPRPALSELRVLGRSLRRVLDPFSHHLGNKTVPTLDPPQPEGRTLEVPFTLEAAPPGASWIGLNVVQVVGIEGDPDYSDRVRQGELLTRVLLNGQPVDNLNRHVTVRNDSPLRLRLPVPEGVLKAGENVLRFEQDGMKDSPETVDNLGLWGLTLEIDSPGEAAQP